MQYTRSIKRSTNSGLNTGFLKNESSSTQKGRVLELARVVWRSSWWLRSCGKTTRSSSSSSFVCCDLHKPPSWSRAKKHLVSI
ncbi:hypothetical protein Taro_023907 [Colocasia esculenta]|uniref:Uncharacterized protein n=1 Tax=Colocasia esculenta TaxID=4460 RepID=A0A843UYQ9_COLES|nr:hypothetical protein [Colocasia esculenta]